jgi:hypothetical protein
MPKNDGVLRLECDDEILTVAADSYLPAIGLVVAPDPGQEALAASAGPERSRHALNKPDREPRPSRFQGFFHRMKVALVAFYRRSRLAQNTENRDLPCDLRLLVVPRGG